MTLKTIRDNPLLLTDGYNNSHGFLKKSVNFEASHIYMRNSPGYLYGFNEIVTDLLNTKIESKMVIEASEICSEYGVRFPSEMWFDVVDKFRGQIPLKVEALPDGTWCPKGTPFAQVTNTEEGFGELVTWFEPEFLRCSFASACMTHAHEIYRYLAENGCGINRIHSFGFRGHNSLENAYWAGTAWAMWLPGSDDLHVLAHTDKGAIKSIPASAHKVVQQFDDELESYMHAVEATAREGYKFLAIPIDTYDPERFIEEYSLKIANRALDLGIEIIFRPDSGDTVKQAVKLYNKTLVHGLFNTSVIIGEGIDFKTVQEYDQELMYNNVPINYVNYGMGAGFYKHLNRDTLGFAMKTCYSNGKNRMKFCKASPIKQSIPGMVNIVLNDAGEKVVAYSQRGLYEIVYEKEARSWRPNYRKQTWQEIRDIALSQDTTQQEVIISHLVQQQINSLESTYLR